MGGYSALAERGAGRRRIRMTWGSGKFLRRFRLPVNVKMDELKATMENGVLTVVVPKEDPKKPEVRTIEVSGN